MSSWIDLFLERYAGKFHDLTLSQILTGFEMVLEDKNFVRCDEYISWRFGEQQPKEEEK